jgi:two-component system, NarL family, response regulator DesR
VSAKTHALETIKSMMTPHIPIRVFLLSGSRFLGEALGRVLRRSPDIHVVGASSHSAATSEEIIESMCDVLLTESVSVLALDSQISDDQLCSLSHLKVVMIEMDENDPAISKLERVLVMRYLLEEAAVADVITAIREVSNGESIYLPQLQMRQISMGVSTTGQSDP